MLEREKDDDDDFKHGLKNCKANLIRFNIRWFSEAYTDADHKTAQEHLINAENSLESHKLEHGSTDEIDEKERNARQRNPQKPNISGLWMRNPWKKMLLKTKATNLSIFNLKHLNSAVLRWPKLEERVELMRNDALLSDLPDSKQIFTPLRQTCVCWKRISWPIDSSWMPPMMRVRKHRLNLRSQITDQLDSLLRHVWGHEPQTTMSDDGTPHTIGGLDFLTNGKIKSRTVQHRFANGLARSSSV